MKQFKFVWDLMEKVRIKQILIFFVVVLYVLTNLVSPLLFSFLIDNVVLEEVLNSLSYSIFDNYDVSIVMFEVNGKEIGYVDINDKK